MVSSPPSLVISGLALLFSKNEKLEECYEPLPGSESPPRDVDGQW
jgi:hypothetical protein